MNLKLIFSCVFISLLLAACSSSQKTTESQENSAANTVKKDSLYIFDAVPSVEKTNTVAEKTAPSPERMKMTYYVVQIGAFNSQEAADEFATNSRKKINYAINVSYNPDVKLYVVQLTSDYTSHDEAERVRNELWQMNDFKDAWIATVQK